MEKLDYITPIEKELREGIIAVAERYLEVGELNRDLSPRWLNLNLNSEEHVVYIRSTQCSIGFNVVLPKGYPRVMVDEFWGQFKRFRTELLIKEYPMINPY